MLQFDEYKVKLNNLAPTLEELGKALDLESAERELDMLQAESAADAEIVRQSFQARVDAMADETNYPEEAGMWKNNATVSVNGNYVVLEVLPDGCTVPDAFLAKF